MSRKERQGGTYIQPLHYMGMGGGRGERRRGEEEKEGEGDRGAGYEGMS